MLGNAVEGLSKDPHQRYLHHKFICAYLRLPTRSHLHAICTHCARVPSTFLTTLGQRIARDLHVFAMSIVKTIHVSR